MRMLCPSHTRDFPRRHKTSNQGIEGYHPGQKANRRENVLVLFSDQIIRSQNKIKAACQTLGIEVNKNGEYMKAGSVSTGIVEKTQVMINRAIHHPGDIVISAPTKIAGLDNDSRKYSITITSSKYESIDDRIVSFYNIKDNIPESYECSCGCPETMFQPCTHVILVHGRLDMEWGELPKHMKESELIRCYQVRVTI